MVGCDLPPPPTWRLETRSPFSHPSLARPEFQPQERPRGLYRQSSGLRPAYEKVITWQDHSPSVFVGLDSKENWVKFLKALSCWRVGAGKTQAREREPKRDGAGPGEAGPEPEPQDCTPERSEHPSPEWRERGKGSNS